MNFVTQFLYNMYQYFLDNKLSEVIDQPSFHLVNKRGKGHGKKAHTRSGAAAIKRQAKKNRNKNRSK